MSAPWHQNDAPNGGVSRLVERGNETGLLRAYNGMDRHSVDSFLRCGFRVRLDRQHDRVMTCSEGFRTLPSALLMTRILIRTIQLRQSLIPHTECQSRQHASMNCRLDELLGHFLRKKRGEATYAQFGRKLGLSASTLYRLETGGQSATIQRLEQILTRLKCKVSDVFPD